MLTRTKRIKPRPKAQPRDKSDYPECGMLGCVGTSVSKKGGFCAACQSSWYRIRDLTPQQAAHHFYRMKRFGQRAVTWGQRKGESKLKVVHSHGRKGRAA